MTVENIIKEVRWCFDEEAVNAAGIADVSAYDFDNGTHTDEGLMNNIIRSRITDAVMWVCRYGSYDILSGFDNGVPTGAIEEHVNVTATNGLIELPYNFVRLLRVRGNNWKRAIINPISEDSDEYLQLSDDYGAAATNDRPQAVFINKGNRSLEVWPNTDQTFDYTCVVFPSLLTLYTEVYPFDDFIQNAFTEQSSLAETPDAILFDTVNNRFVARKGTSVLNPKYYMSWQNGSKYMSPSSSYGYQLAGAAVGQDMYRWNGTTLVLNSNTDIAVPQLMRPALFYYLAFLTLSAYEDPRAARMLDIAKMNLGLTQER